MVHSPPRPGHAPSAARLTELIDGMAGQKVLMLVDLVADRFITGTPKRISREAPVLILRYEGETLTPGGGANAVANVQALDGMPLPVGVVGDDGNGQRLLQELEARGVATGGVLRKAGFQTPTKTRILGGGRHSIKQQIVRYDIEDHLALDAAEVADLRGRIAVQGKGPAEERPRVAVLSDYGYGTVDPDLAGEVRAALAPGGIVLCDSRYRLQDFRGMDGATPNEEEAEALLGGSLEEDPGRAEEAALRLRRELEARFLLITRGSRGMLLVEEGGAVHVPVFGTDQVADVTGAGDTVIGTFALALAAGASPLEATLLANFAGGLVVLKMGTATLDREELREAVLSDPEFCGGLSWGAQSWAK